MVTTVSKHIGDKTIAVIGGLAILGLIAYFIFTRIGNNTSTTTNPSSTSQNPSLSSPSTSSASSSPTQSGASGNFLPNESKVSFSSPASELPSGGSIGITSSHIIDSFNTTETYAPKNIVNNSTVNNSTTSSSIVTNNNQKTITVNNQGGEIVKKKSTSSGTTQKTPVKSPPVTPPASKPSFVSKGGILYFDDFPFTGYHGGHMYLAGKQILDF